jgi:hypothetical protein
MIREAEIEVREMAQQVAVQRGQLKKGGRPTKFSYRRVMRVLRYLRDGSPAGMAAEAGGIAHATWNEWCEKFPKLDTLARRAENRGLAEMVREVRNGKDIKGNDDWKARMALIERRRRADFGPPKAEAVNVTVNNNTVNVAVTPVVADSVMSLHEQAMRQLVEQKKSGRFPQIPTTPPAHAATPPALDIPGRDPSPGCDPAP